MTPAAGVSSAFVASHRQWVDQQAWSLLRRVPANVERADLVQVGLIAVWQCAGSFEDTGEPDAFKRYAGRRVKGAMLDELRRSDWLTRGERQRVRDGEIAVELVGDQENESATAHDSVEAEVDRSMILAKLAEHRLPLTERDKDVIDAYLGGSMTPAEVAQAHGVTPSRISRVFSGLVGRIRAALHDVPPAPRPSPPPPPPKAYKPPAAYRRSTPRPPPRMVALTPHMDLDELFSSDIVRGCTSALLTQRMG